MSSNQVYHLLIQVNGVLLSYLVLLVHFSGEGADLLPVELVHLLWAHVLTTNLLFCSR